jgi:hypothetical protein
MLPARLSPDLPNGLDDFFGNAVPFVSYQRLDSSLEHFKGDFRLALFDTRWIPQLKWVTILLEPHGKPQGPHAVGD